MNTGKSRFTRSISLIAICILLLIVFGPFLVPVPPVSGTLPTAQLVDPDSRFAKLNGLQVHYKIQGQGEPVFILLHGFGASLYSWQSVMDPFSRLGTVIAYDRPAFGLTERPMAWQGGNPYGTQANLEILKGLLDQLNISTAILVGNSAGGTLAMQFALQSPERVQALILVDPAVFSEGGPGWVQLLGKLPQVQHLGPLLVRSIQSRGMEMIETAWHDPAHITPETVELYRKPLQAENWDKALWYFTLAGQPSGLQERLQDFSLPILVITGEDDRIVPTENSLKLADQLPGAQLTVIQEAGHVPHEEQPLAFMQAVQAFLASLPNQ